MANYRYPKTIVIREINADTYETYFDYWFDTQRLKQGCDELHTIWGSPPTPEATND